MVETTFHNGVTSVGVDSLQTSEAAHVEVTVSHSNLVRNTACLTLLCACVCIALVHERNRLVSCCVQSDLLLCK